MSYLIKFSVDVLYNYVNHDVGDIVVVVVVVVVADGGGARGVFGMICSYYS